jgi:predicted nucleic acid-binding protein
MGFIIDTCIWVDVERGKIAPMDVEVFTGQTPVFLAPITIAELTVGMEMSKNETIRRKRQAALNRLKKKPVLIIDENTADIFGRIASGLLKSGKSHRHRINDIWIASLGIQHDFKLLTRNIKDFCDIEGLQLLEFKTSL